MKDEEIDRLLEQYGKPFESVKVPDESRKRLKEGVLNRINQRRPFSLPASAWVAVALLFALALGVSIYPYLARPKTVIRGEIPNTAPTRPAVPELQANALEQALDQMSEEDLVLLVLELDDDELTLQLGDEIYAADLESAEFAEWST